MDQIAIYSLCCILSKYSSNLHINFFFSLSQNWVAFQRYTYRKKGYLNIYIYNTAYIAACASEKMAKYTTTNIKCKKTHPTHYIHIKHRCWKDNNFKRECLFWRLHVRTCVYSYVDVYTRKKLKINQNSMEIGSNQMEWNEIRALVCASVVQFQSDMIISKLLKSTLFLLLSLSLISLSSFYFLLPLSIFFVAVQIWEFLFIYGHFFWYITYKSKVW